jgi:hypothetical protein
VHGRYEQEGHAPPLHVKAMFDLSLTSIEAELAWIEGCIDELSADQVPGT